MLQPTILARSSVLNRFTLTIMLDRSRIVNRPPPSDLRTNEIPSVSFKPQEGLVEDR